MPVIRAPYPAFTPPPTLPPNATDFSTYTVGQPPSDWTPKWATSNGQWVVRADTNSLSGKVLKPEFTANARRAITWDKVGSVTVVETLALVRADTPRGTTSVNDNNRVLISVSGNAGAENGYYLTLSANDIHAFRYSNAAVTQVGFISTNVNASAGRIWLRFSRLSSSSLKLKVWVYGQPESTAVLLDMELNTPLLGAGDAGLGMFHFAGNPHFEFFSYSLDTAVPAPGPA